MKIAKGMIVYCVQDHLFEPWIRESVVRGFRDDAYICNESGEMWDWFRCHNVLTFETEEEAIEMVKYLLVNRIDSLEDQVAKFEQLLEILEDDK